MEEILALLASEMAPIINTIVIAVVGAVSTAVGVQIRKLVKRMERHEAITEITDALRNNKEIVQASVEYVESIGKNLASERKFELAKAKALEFANKYGASMSDSELDILIEQAVYNLKKGYNQAEEEDELFELRMDDDTEVKYVNGEQVDGYDIDRYNSSEK